MRKTFQKLKERLSNFNVNDDVFVKNFKTNKFQKGKIVNILGVNTYMVSTGDDKIWKRHTNQLSKNTTYLKNDDNAANTIQETFNDILKKNTVVSVSNGLTALTDTVRAGTSQSQGSINNWGIRKSSRTINKPARYRE